MNLGATYLGKGQCQFLVWAPLAQQVTVHLTEPRDRVVAMERLAGGYHHTLVEDVQPGSLYLYKLDGSQERPDPASRFQPHGVHGTSQVVDARAFTWEDQGWRGLPLPDYVIYELHVGVFTPQGTFDAIIPRLGELKELGITALELMPVAQCPGSRNWGYDGVYPFAVQNSYGGPESLKKLVNACHRRGLAVVLDVIYNHLGPEGNYLWDFGPYFTDRYKTPWGPALNFDGPHSDQVRRFFLENALYWLTEFHLDALRLDAIHAILDHSARPFLEELAIAAHQQGERLNRRIFLIAESNLNDVRIIQRLELGGYGLDAQWNDDFHHALHTLLTGEQFGYYQDFGTVQYLAKAFSEGFAYTGQYSPFRQRRHGNSSRFIPAQRLVVFTQNHDQAGNRMLGERLSQLVSFEAWKLAAGAVLLSPFIPLLFMGEEYGETAPFQYFISHSDQALIEAVRQGRREEFATFQWQGEVPDPQDEATFRRSKLHWELRSQGQHQLLFELYRELLRLRRTLPALAQLSKDHLEAVGWEKEKVLFVRRWTEQEQVFMVFNFSQVQLPLALPVPAGSWQKQLDSAERRWGGAGSTAPATFSSEGTTTLSLAPQAFVLFVQRRSV
ncbi:MAG: malto-oligosyltrehalose trehalohydrolase [Deinococcus sp.]|nr:malto-oligosyltrehalose trehalohydrolase [Deinococcus sp.]